MALFLAIAVMLIVHPSRAIWKLLRACSHRRSSTGMKHRRRAPPTPRNRRKPQWVIDAVIHLKALQPSVSHRTLATQFNRRYAVSRQMSVSSSFVHYTLRAQRLAILRKRREIKSRIPSSPPINDVWGLDMSGKTDTSGTLYMMLAILDHGSRRSLALTALPNKTAWTSLGHLCLAIGEHGKPRSIRTDNESMFTSNLFASALRLFGIRHQRIEAGCPWQNGRVERFFGTLKQSLNFWQVANHRQLQAALDVFREWYCCIRPHANLNGATPQEAWEGVDPYRRAPVALEWFDEWDGLLTGFRIRR